MYDIPNRLVQLSQTKQQMANVIASTGQNTNIPFRQYDTLITNIPNTGAITPAQVNDLTNLAISISGEKA